MDVPSRGAPTDAQRPAHQLRPLRPAAHARRSRRHGAPVPALRHVLDLWRRGRARGARPDALRAGRPAAVRRRAQLRQDRRALRATGGRPHAGRPHQLLPRHLLLRRRAATRCTASSPSCTTRASSTPRAASTGVRSSCPRSSTRTCCCPGRSSRCTPTSPSSAAPTAPSSRNGSAWSCSTRASSTPGAGPSPPASPTSLTAPAVSSPSIPRVPRRRRVPFPHDTIRRS